MYGGLDMIDWKGEEETETERVRERKKPGKYCVQHSSELSRRYRRRGAMNDLQTRRVELLDGVSRARACDARVFVTAPETERSMCDILLNIAPDW